MRRLGLLAALLLALQVVAFVPLAQADPLPADYSGATAGDVLSVGLVAAGVEIGADLGHTETATDSTATTRAHAESANLGADVLGIGVGLSQGEANSTTTTATDSYNTGFGQVDLPPVLDTGLVTGAGATNWPGDLVCVPDGAPIAQSSVELASADVGLTLSGVGLDIVSVDTISTTGQTTLQSGDVVSTAAGDLAGLSLFNGLVDVEVLTNPVLTATSTGTSTAVTANAYAVAVTIGGVTTELTAGMSIPISLNVGVLAIDATLSVGGINDISTATTASGSMTFLSLTGTVEALTVEVASLDIGVLPISASATGPAGDPDGVQCTLLDEAPVISTPTNGDTTGETPTISGTGIPGADLTVYDTDGTTVIGTTTVTSGGTWTLVPATPLALGSHTITATQQVGDAVSPSSNAVTFTVADLTPPAAPVITSPTEGSVTNDSTPTISGTGEAGASVEVSVDGAVIGTTTVLPGGTWSLDVPTVLTDGDHTVSATQTDAADNVSSESVEVTFEVDTGVPAAPVITSPTEGSVTNDTTPTISGTGEAGASVEVSVDGAVIGTTTVLPGGTWSLDVPTALAEGDHTVSATQTDEAGNTSLESVEVTFEVDTGVPAAPVITSPTEGSSTNDSTPTISGTGEVGATVEVSVDGAVIGTTTVLPGGTWSFDVPTVLAEGDHTASATQTDEAGNTSPASATVTFEVDTTAPAAPVISTPADGTVTSDTTPTVTGSGEPGLTLEVRADGVLVGTTTVAGDGSWALDSSALAPGTHVFVATQLDAAGNLSPDSNQVSVTIDTAAAAPAITGPADGSTLPDSTPTITGTGEPGATVTVSIDGVDVGTAVVAPDGAWSLTPTTPLDDGDHTISATQVDQAGNASAASQIEITVDTVAPAAPVIVSPASGEELDDTTPTITGTGEPGATVIVEVDGEEIGSVEVDSDGTWSITVPDELDDGPHRIDVVQVDAAGNRSASATALFAVAGVSDDADDDSLAATGANGGLAGLALLGLALSGVGIVLRRKG